MNLLDLLFPTANVRISDVFVAPIWVSANIIAFRAAWEWSRRLFPEDSYLELIGHTILLVWSAIVITAITLGAIGWLSGPLLVLSVMGIGSVALVSRRFLAKGQLFTPVPFDRTEMIWLLLWVSLFGWWIGHILTEGLLHFPDDFDSLSYHIPMVDHWLQARSLSTTDFLRWSTPGNNELLALWSVGSFSGDFLVSLNNLPTTVLLASSTVHLGTRVGLVRPLAHLSGFVVVCNYVVLKQLVSAGNDVAVVACFFAAISYILRHTKFPQAETQFLGSLSLGLLAGLKYYALGYAALAFTVWLLLSATTHRFHLLARVFVAGMTGMLLLAGFWYFRNFLITGSPFFPMQILQGTNVLPQIYPNLTETTFFGNHHPELLVLFRQAVWKMSGPCQLLAVSLVPATLGWLVGSALWVAIYTSYRSLAMARLALFLLLVGSGILLGITPFAVEDDPGTLNQIRWGYCPVRYGLCFLSTTIIAAALCLQDILMIRWRGKRTALSHNNPKREWGWLMVGGHWFIYGTILSLNVFQLWWARLPMARFDNTLIMVNVLLLGGINVVMVHLFESHVRVWRVILFMMVLMAAAVGIATLSDRWHQGFISHYSHRPTADDVYWLERIDSQDHVISILDYRYYPYFGSRRQYRVIQPVYVYSPEWLIEFLEENKVNIVGTKLHWQSPIRNRFQGFDECLLLHPDRFREISRSSNFALYEFLQQQPSGERSP